MVVEFTKTFNVESYPKDYKSFIESLRHQARDASSLRLRFRRDSLYLIAYQKEGENEQWNEFKGEFQVVPGSKVLRFDGGYDTLTNLAKRRDEIKLGRENLKGAVHTLAKNPESDKEKAHALLIIIQMTSESMRFKEICNKGCATSRSRSVFEIENTNYRPGS
ncbi:ribosome-inactivating protein [Aspergillus sergii]|uniref:rRNA N-glycosylase n=1 Tax=Aspergillus sergii TaxID=1034303 RepID=A0A5N6XKJ9_9EURO|nr:ribosome-inactivating protein [Aspergillus sergii]